MTKTILTRPGNKTRQAAKYIPHFPKHSIYIEPFFGAGGMFFSKTKAKYNFLNDNDSDVYNLFNVVMERKEEFIEAFRIMPIHETLFREWMTKKETEPIRKALRFVLLSNFSCLGQGDTLAYVARTPELSLLRKIKDCQEKLFGCRFHSVDFRYFFKSLPYSGGHVTPEKAFFYSDPPYLGTDNNYEDRKTWSEKDVTDLFDANEKTGCKFAYSEFDHPFILEQAERRNLNVIVIGERKNLKNRRTEILITNYDSPVQTLF